MTAVVLDGVAVAREIYAELKTRIATLKRRGIEPALATLLVGDNPASAVYVRNKVRRCTELGLTAELRQLPADSREAAVATTLDELNHDERIHGIIVQLPLPKRLNAQRISQSIALEKDVDGFNWCNLGALVEGDPKLAPCTPLGVMRLLDHARIEIEGRHAVVIGRSSIVGKPLALMLIGRGATVTVCNSKTPDLAAFTRSADILVAATGRARLVTADMVKAGAAVIDVGITRRSDGTLAGDVDYERVREKAAAITPVPGGVGPMTIAMLLANTVSAAERHGKAQ